MSSSFTQVFTNDSISFFVMTEQYLIVYIHHNLIICWWALRLFSYLATVKNAAINMRVHISLQYPVFISFSYIPRSSIDGSNGRSIFNISRNFHIVFHSNWTNLHFHSQCICFPFSPYPCWQLLSIVFLMITI